MRKIYWIGPRESDIDINKDFFSGSITIYGSNIDNNKAYCNNNIRINHNIECPEADAFIKKELYAIMDKESDVCFLFYDPYRAFLYGEKILQRSIGLTKKDLFEIFADKRRARNIFQSVVNIIPFMEMTGENINISFLKGCFNADKFIVQKRISSGGEGTFLYSRDSSKELNFDGLDQYIVSPYIEGGIPINTHIFITDDNYYIFPSSIQICEYNSHKILYYGADYICYNKFLSHKNQDILSHSEKICRILKKYGYRGVAGIDWLLTPDTIYFVEINPRFQASTDLLNRALYEKFGTTLQKLQVDFFEELEKPISGIFTDFKVPYSNYVFTDENTTYEHISVVGQSDEIVSMQMDGFDYPDKAKLAYHPYLCRGIFKKNICAISNGKLSVHPNLAVVQLRRLLEHSEISYKTAIKIALINHGVRISQDARIDIEKNGVILNAVFDAIDIRIFDSIYVNVPYHCPFSSISPFCIDRFENGTALFFDGEYICNASVVMLPQPLVGRTTSTGVPYEAVIQLATDRIRINPAPVCIYKQNNKECRFCNLPKTNSFYTQKDIFEIIDVCLQEVEFRHFLIGGGTITENGGWEIIIQICKYIRTKCKKDIYLMTIPPQNLNILKTLKEAGVTEVAFNLEIFNRDLAKSIMPGKGYIPESVYKSAFIEAVKLWGSTGNVRSLIIYGFDSDNMFIKGIEWLCSYGVQPIISAFRPLINTELSAWNPPATKDIVQIYQKCTQIAEKYGLSLGPDCLPCRNNTISSTE